MDPENLSKKYQLLLQENQLLKERILLLESALKQAEVPLVEDTSCDYLKSKSANSPTLAIGKSNTEPEEKPFPTLNKYSSACRKNPSVHVAFQRSRGSVRA